MLDDGAVQAEDCALCVIGAGIAGLNALYVASSYLAPTDKVILIDRNPAAGGMWNTTYPYVRLHQPHPMFTVGDLKWNWRKPPAYLARRDEVQDHLSRSLSVVKKRLNLQCYFGQSCDDVTENADAVLVRTSGAAGPKEFRAQRVIDARALDITNPPPLTFLTDQVRSIAPPDLMAADIPADAPIYVVGGGKTAMDTILAILDRNPDQTITLIKGQGTIFANRDQYLPQGVRRYFGGTMFLKSFIDITMRFDGDNENAVFNHFRERYAISVDGEGEQFLYGLLSPLERDRIAAGLTDILPGYLEDVVQSPTGPEAVMRDGRRLSIPRDAIFVRCTGHIFTGERPKVSCISPQGRIMRLTGTDAMHFLTSISGYFLSHVFLRGDMDKVPLYLIDNEELVTHGRKLWQMASATQSVLNSIHLVNALPFKVADGCGLDLDRWYPLHRRLAALIDIKRNGPRYISHAQQSLDRVMARTGMSRRILSEIVPKPPAI